MEFKLLEALIQVAESGSMTDAAPALRCTAPAVSQKIARLEHDLETSLFIRTPYGVTPTPAGEALLKRAHQLVGLRSDARNEVREAALISTRRLRMSSFSSANVNLVPEATSVLREQFPEIELSLVETDYDNPFLDVVTGAVDLTVAFEYDHVPVETIPGVVTQALGHEPLHVVLPVSHPLSSKRSIHLNDLADEHWVFFPQHNVARVSVEAETAHHDFMPKVTFETRDYQAIHVLVGANLGISLLPALMAAEFDMRKVTTRPLRASTLGRSIFIARREGTPSEPLSAMHRALVDAYANAGEQKARRRTPSGK